MHHDPMPRRRALRRLLAATLVATATVAGVLSSVAVAPAGAVTLAIDVTTTADVVGGDGQTSLREAFTQASTDLHQNVIILQPGATYVLDRCQGGTDEEANVGGDLDHSAPETLEVQGNGATIRQTCPIERVVHKRSATGNLVLEQVTVEGGVAGGAGGGVLGAGQVLLDEVSFRDNVSVSGGGGAVFATGDLYVDDSTFEENASSSSGGALRTDGDLFFFTSTAARNVSGSHGGAAYTPNTVQSRNSTLTQNNAVYGGAVEAGSVQLLHSTVVANRASFGANVAGGELNPIGSIIALGSVGEDCDISGPTISAAVNVGDDGSCNLDVGGGVEGVHPMVADLASWGGPTELRRPVAPSPAFDLDDDGACLLPHDQRLQPRPIGPGCEAGSFEGDALPCGQTFAEVDGSHPFFAEICWLAQMDISGGYPDGGFHPTAAVSRQAMAAFLHRLAGSPRVFAPVLAEFPDVPTTHPFAAEISWLVEEQITEGYEDGTFRPGASVSRQAMAAFLYRIAGEPLVPKPPQATFDDVGAAHPFSLEIEWLAGTGVASGYADGGFHPASPVSRQAMAAFLLRMAEHVMLAGI